VLRTTALVAAIAGGCASAETLVVLRFDADEAGEDRAASMHLRVCDQDNRIAIEGRHELGGELDWPFRAELAPRDGDPSRRFYAVAETRDGSAAALERKLVVSSYTAGVERLEDVLFDGTCLGTPECGLGLTCEAGACVDARRAPVAVSGAPEVPAACRTLDDTGCEGLAGLLFCDGFEGAMPLDSPWTERSDGGLFEVTRTAYRGSQAGRATTSEAGSSAKASAEGAITGTPAELHARAYFRVPARGAAFAFAEILRLEQIEPRYTIGVQVSQDFELRIIMRDGAGATEVATPLAVAADEWFCVSLSVAIADTGRVTLRTAGGEPFEHDLDTRPSAGYDRLSAGVVFGTDGAAEVDVDEVALGTSPIGCED
jgi:hypothetical protein